MDMKEISNTHKWFFENSKSYMEGYSKWYYYTNLPIAYFRFMYFTIKK